MTMFYVWLILAAVSAYLLGGVNSAILLSVGVYRKDIRSEGSGNPGFTNFKRVFGWRYAWLVMVCDLLKAAIPVLVFALIFQANYGMWQFGAAFTGLFAMLGHCYPVWYRFQGGKAFLTGVSTIFFVDWRVGLCSVALFLVLLFVVKYMSLASVCQAASCPILLIVFGAPVQVCLLSICSALLVIWRHRPNLVRLCKGTEKKFSLFGKSKSKN